MHSLDVHRKMKKTLTLIVFSVLLASSSYSATPLIIKAKALVNSEGNMLRVGIVLVNQSNKEIIVLTSPDSKILGRGVDDTLILTAGFGGKYEMLGHQLIPSISKYEPVPLKPSEASGFFFTIESNTIEMKVGEEIIIQYSIGQDLSDKYKIPSSPITTKTELRPLLNPIIEM